MPQSSYSTGRRLSFFTTAAIALAAAMLAGIAIGSVSIPTSTVLSVLAAHLWPGGGAPNDANDAIVWLVRTPRVIVAALVGASLAVSGAQMQGVFRNGLASPDVTGSAAGGALGAVIALASGLATRSLFYLPLMSFAGTLLTLFTVYAMATRRGRTPVATLLLAGVALGSLVGALTSLVISLRWVRWEVAQEILFWLMGGLDSRTWQHVWLLLPVFLVGFACALLFARDLDVMQLGEETATAVGLDVEAVKRNVITGASLLVGGAVAVSGMIGFVGLIVPHMVRSIVGPAHRWLIPACALGGAAFLVLADIFARTIQRPEELRLGIVTSVVGAPFFLYLLLRGGARVGMK